MSVIVGIGGEGRGGGWAAYALEQPDARVVEVDDRHHLDKLTCVPVGMG
jgi:hypothetical protein